MKIVIKISKIIFILFCLIIISFTLVALATKYDNKKICRTSDEFNVENYLDISNTKEIRLLTNCDKCRIFVILEDTVSHDNINGVILQLTNKKKQYNDNLKLEVILVNDYLNYLIYIDEEERIDIDYSS